MLQVPFLVYSLSDLLGLPGSIGSGSLASPKSWNGFSSMHTTGALSSYGCSYKSRMSSPDKRDYSIQATKAAFWCGGMFQYLFKCGFNSFFLIYCLLLCGSSILQSQALQTCWPEGVLSISYSLQAARCS